MQNYANPPLQHYHESWWKVEGECVWYLGGRCDNDPTLKAGAWYFSDEAQQMQGPFNTRSEAEAALASYSEGL